MECFTTEPDAYRTSLDHLFSEDDRECLAATNRIKNLIIGSNKQKSLIIADRLFMERITHLLQNENKPLYLRLDAAIIIGSLAKGTEANVIDLAAFKMEEILLNIALNPNTDPKLIESALSVLRSLLRYPNKIRSSTTFFQHSEDINTLSRLIQLASPETTINCQSFVANILLSFCGFTNGNELNYTNSNSVNLCQAGGIPFLARLIQSDFEELQLPALKTLAAMCLTNRAVSDIVCATNFQGKPILDVLTALVSRSSPPIVQLATSKCLVFIYRSGSSFLKSTDHQIVYKTLPTLARLCQPEFDEPIRAEAAESLAYLSEIDSELQRISAISNHLISNLSNLLNCNQQSSKEAALKCFASLAANDETIRKRIIDMRGLIDEVLSALKESGTESLRVAAVRCLHSLSRSVHLLRTTFQDHKIWKPLMSLIYDKPSQELLTVVSSTICNLLLEFSPAKESLLESGIIEILCNLTKSQYQPLRLNAVWALMNMAFQADQNVKTEIISKMGTERISILLNDQSERVIMKTLGFLRNLLSSTVHIESIMAKHAPEILSAVWMVLDSPSHSSEIKEQAICIIGNLAAGAHELIIEDEKILLKLKECLQVDDSKLKNGALFAIKNLMHKSARHDRLKEVGIINKLHELVKAQPDVELDDEIRDLMKHS